MIKFGFQGRREEKVLGKGFREERGEENGIWDWFSELGFREKGREMERKDSELGLWVELGFGEKGREIERKYSELGLWVLGLLFMIVEKILGFFFF